MDSETPQQAGPGRGQQGIWTKKGIPANSSGCELCAMRKHRGSELENIWEERIQTLFLDKRPEVKGERSGLQPP